MQSLRVLIKPVSLTAPWPNDVRMRGVNATYRLTLTVWRTLPDAGPDLARLAANAFHFSQFRETRETQRGLVV